MKKFVLVLFLSSIYIVLPAQRKTSINLSVLADTVKVRHYEYKDDPSPAVKTLIINVKFNDETILNEDDLSVLNTGLTKVIAVDYVYTQYSDRKSQSNLNKKRLLELQLAAPSVFDQNMTCWKFVEQLGFTINSDASKLFHGFVIRYQESKPYRVRSPLTVREDIASIMKSPKPNKMKDVFNRNPDFTKELIVADYTCSMSPYYLELMAWFCLQDMTEKTSFAFFNDGDGMPNDQKIIGRTGGVHQFKTKSLDTIAEKIFETIKTGCSGDSPENDVEAVIKAIEENKDVKEVILLADNWSDMRDISLLAFVGKPVHVILCGTEYGINPQYLNLAKRTKGSVHTMTEDLKELFKIREGQKFSFGGQEFIVLSGQIVKWKKT